MGKARTWDPTAGFSIDAVTAGLCRLYTLKDGQLVPHLDEKRMPPACPITLAPIEDPVLLEDGYVYEQAAIAQWLENNSNAPCTNVEVRNMRLLKLDPFRILVNRFTRQTLSWKARLLNLADEAECNSIPLPIRCQRVERAVASCVVEAAELERGLKNARRIAQSLRNELHLIQELEICKVQAAARGWLVRRQFCRLQKARALQLLKSAVQVHSARQCIAAAVKQRTAHAIVRIQRWWRRHQPAYRIQEIKMDRRTRRSLARQKKKGRDRVLRAQPAKQGTTKKDMKEIEKALWEEPAGQPANAAKPHNMFYIWNPETGEFSRSPASASGPSRASRAFERNAPKWEKFVDNRGTDIALNSETGEVAWATKEGSAMPELELGLDKKWKKHFTARGEAYYFNKETFEKWTPGDPECDNPIMLTMVDEIALFLACVGLWIDSQVQVRKSSGSRSLSHLKKFTDRSR